MPVDKTKTEGEIEFEAQRIHQMLVGGKHPTPDQLNSVFDGFSDKDKSRVESSLMEMFYKDFKSVENILDKNMGVAELFRAALKDAVRHFDGGRAKLAQDDAPIDGSKPAKQIYDLMADSNGNWSSNKPKIQQIFENLSNRERAQVNELVFNLMKQAPNETVHERYYEVAQLAIQANEKAQQELQGRTAKQSPAQEQAQIQAQAQTQRLNPGRTR